MSKRNYHRVTDKYERKTMKAVLSIEYEVGGDYLKPEQLQVLEMAINPDYKGVQGLRVVSVKVIDPAPIERDRGED